MSKSNYLENKVVDHSLGTATFTKPTTVYASLHTADPGETGASELTGGSYARQAIAFGAASNGSASNTADVNFTGMPAATITHFAIWDAASAGNPLWIGALSASKTTNAGDTFVLQSGQVTISDD